METADLAQQNAGNHAQNYLADAIENSRFEYIGKTAVTVTGAATGQKYRFSYPGDVQQVDYKDIPGMMAVPVLRKVGINR